MKVNYKNWIPKGMILSSAIGAAISFGLLIGLRTIKIVKVDIIFGVLSVIFLSAFLFCIVLTTWSIYAYNMFSYTGKRKLSKQIIEGILEYIVIPEGGLGLDVGCGSGSLTIACAKRNSKSTMIGVDRWWKRIRFFQ